MTSRSDRGDGTTAPVASRPAAKNSQAASAGQSARPGLSTAAVVDAALALVDEQGEASLTLSAVADRTRVATPSLYKHVRNLAHLRQLVAVRVMEELTHRLGNAAMGRSSDEAVAGVMLAWRSYATDYPARYALVPLNPLGDPVLVEAGGRLLEIILAVLRGYGLEGADAIHAARCMRAAVHGFASLEAAGGFGLSEDLEVSYERLLRIMTDGLRDWTIGRPRPKAVPTNDLPC